MTEAQRFLSIKQSYAYMKESIHKSCSYIKKSVSYAVKIWYGVYQGMTNVSRPNVTMTNASMKKFSRTDIVRKIVSRKNYSRTECIQDKYSENKWLQDKYFLDKWHHLLDVVKKDLPLRNRGLLVNQLMKFCFPTGCWNKTEWSIARALNVVRVWHSSAQPFINCLVFLLQQMWTTE